MRTLGIDIGTTSICAVCYEQESGEVTANVSCRNAFQEGSFCQDPDEIVRKVKVMLQELTASDGAFAAIGISAQMHGILYVDRNGKAVTPYYTWKDEKGNTIRHTGQTYAQYLSERTGYAMFSGYGTVTHFYLQEMGLIPEKAVKIANIGDYLAIQLCGCREPVTDATIAASFGGFDLKRGIFDMDKLAHAGVEVRYYPALGRTGQIAGYYENIPVYCAWGDNQASFYAAASDDRSMVSINVGTGSQVSLFDAEYMETEAADIRPFLGKGYLYVGASTNGGKVYERLAEFLEEMISPFAKEDVDIYEWMERTGRQKAETTLRITPALYGARGAHSQRGSVENLTAENFHPADFIRAYVEGMARELLELYEAFPGELKKGRTRIAASGNGIRKNALLRQAVEKLFQMPVTEKVLQEEAAAGAAMLAAEFWKALTSDL